MPLHIGIDPGIGGAIAWIEPDGRLQIHDMPVMGERATINAVALVELLELLARGMNWRPVHALLEHAQAMPGQGVSSTFAYGRGFGTIEGVLYALGMPHTLVRPAVWKRRAGVSSDKRATIARAIQVCPAAAPYLRRAKDHGRAEALLISIYGQTA